MKTREEFEELLDSLLSHNGVYYSYLCRRADCGPDDESFGDTQLDNIDRECAEIMALYDEMTARLNVDADDIKLSEYQRLALRTSGAFGTGQTQYRQSMSMLALAGEVGELCNSYKKRIGHGHDIPDEQFVHELGDVLWYVAEVADALGFNLGEVAMANIEKLHKRYPGGFSERASRERQEPRDGV